MGGAEKEALNATISELNDQLSSVNAAFSHSTVSLSRANSKVQDLIAEKSKLTVTMQLMTNYRKNII